MNTRMMLRINREGDFTVTDLSDGPSQCGRIGARVYKYFVSIQASNAHLNPQGYVMENALCDKYFKDTYEGKSMECPSCETMAQNAVEHFLDLFRWEKDLEGIEVSRILVRIHGSPVSFIEAEWTKP